MIIGLANVASAQDADCIAELIEKESNGELVRTMEILSCVQASLVQSNAAAQEVARVEAGAFVDDYRQEFEEIARKNVVYLGVLNSCQGRSIPVPDIDETTTDDWHILTTRESYSAHFGTGEMRNNALYSFSYSFEPSSDKSSWNGYLSVQVNAATEQKRETTDTCSGGSNKNGSSALLYAIRRHGS